MPVCRRRRPILATRSTINTRMRDLLAPQADALGLRLLKIEVRDLILPGELKRAFAQTITAQKEALASLERARGKQPPCAVSPMLLASCRTTQDFSSSAPFRPSRLQKAIQ
jgi:SPFH domain / Band 7 family